MLFLLPLQIFIVKYCVLFVHLELGEKSETNSGAQKNGAGRQRRMTGVSVGFFICLRVVWQFLLIVYGYLPFSCLVLCVSTPASNF